MKHFSFILLFISFLFPNLDSDKIDQKMLTIDLGAALENPKKTNLFSEAHYIKLESNPDILLGGNLYFETHDDKIYILDRQDQKAVLEFNNKGKFIRKIGWTGGGPEEYQNAVDFLVRKDTVDILVSSYPNSVIYSYLNTGAFIGKKTLPYPAYSFQMVENNYAISTNYNKSASDFHVHLFNNNGEELSKFLPNNSQLDMPAESNCFSICNGETYYFEPFNNKIFHFTNNELVPIFELNFGKYNIPDEFFKKSMMTGFGMINKKGFSLIKNVFENEQFLILQLTRQKEGDPVYLFNFIYNKKSEKLRYAAIGEEDYIFQLPIGITSENELMFLVFPIGDINRAAENFGLNINVSDIKEADNPMILFCKLEE